MSEAIDLLAQPEAWAALATLIVLEVVLGIDNLIFVSILSNKLPEGQRARARRLGISLALVLRLALLSGIAWLVGLTATVFDLGLHGAAGAHIVERRVQMIERQDQRPPERIVYRDCHSRRLAQHRAKID